ncbi:serine hydrolase domain-containing protein [Brevibacillus laterosporus]|uniref:Beta-lactamase family protein n=1 Tax=Brevibacillus laterosporus LMG 15441 TaxID=1042163 RepID=A0A075R4G1_BRELA|nr:serine hydrolase domain-containing protein [Brevibacillus laterosporus]AIG26729.1 beta-lactamase family protein [Brevibacillus laterosporus LMG 15441]RJL14041.1 penicillin-binding protein [Brevibacillus laterosporus]
MLSIESIDAIIQQTFDETRIPGFTIAVLKGEEVVYAKGFGSINKEEGGTPVTCDTIFRIGSLGKPLTGSAIMRLVEAGKVELDIPIINYIPEFRLSDPEAARKVTLRMLLNHTAGFPDGGDMVGKRDLGALGEYVREEISQLTLMAPPGFLHSYSNHHLNLAGYVAERVTGQFFPEFMKEWLFDPLQMSRTLYDPLVAFTYSLALAHDRHPDGSLRVQHNFPENAANYPSYFAMSTVNDLARFALMHLNRGRVGQTQILSPESIEEMHSLQADRFTLSGLASGLTFFRDTYKGVQMIRHAGAISTYNSAILLVPEQKVGVITLSSQDYGWTEAHEILDQMLELPKQMPKVFAAASFQEPPVDKSQWSSYEGTYIGFLKGAAQVRMSDNELYLNLNGEERQLCYVREHFFITYDDEQEPLDHIGFIPKDGEAAPYIMVNSSACQRTTERLYQSDSSLWYKFEGDYTDNVLNFSFRVDDRGPVLIDEDTETVCVPLKDNLFYVDEFGLMEFTEEEEGMMLTFQNTWRYVKA